MPPESSTVSVVSRRRRQKGTSDSVPQIVRPPRRSEQHTQPQPRPPDRPVPKPSPRKKRPIPRVTTSESPELGPRNNTGRSRLKSNILEPTAASQRNEGGVREGPAIARSRVKARVWVQPPPLTASQRRALGPARMPDSGIKDESKLEVEIEMIELSSTSSSSVERDSSPAGPVLGTTAALNKPPSPNSDSSDSNFVSAGQQRRSQQPKLFLSPSPSPSPSPAPSIIIID